MYGSESTGKPFILFLNISLNSVFGGGDGGCWLDSWAAQSILSVTVWVLLGLVVVQLVGPYKKSLAAIKNMIHITHYWHVS